MLTISPKQHYLHPPSNLIIPLDIANIIIDQFDSNLTIMDEADQV